MDRKKKCLKREHKLEDPKNGEQCLNKAKSEVHIHKVAMKGDAAPSISRRFHAHMLHHEVDFIGGDVNMSAFSTVGDVFSVGEFSAPGKPHKKGIQGLDESHKERTGFFIMPRRPYTRGAHKHGCHMFDCEDLGFAPSGLTAHFPVLLLLSVTNPPQPTAVSHAAPKPSSVALTGRRQAGTQTPSQASCPAVCPECFFHVASDKVPPFQDTRHRTSNSYRPSGKPSRRPFQSVWYRLGGNAPTNTASLHTPCALLRSHWRSQRCS